MNMTQNLRTPTETLMSALSECETAEYAMIIMLHGDAVTWHSSTPSMTINLGLLGYAEVRIKDYIRGMPAESESAEGDS